MCGGQGYGQQPMQYGQQNGLQMPKFNPMTTNPNGGPAGHFLDQWQNPQAPRMQPHLAPPWTNRPTNPYAGSTATGEPALPGQAVGQPFMPPGPSTIADPTQGQLMDPRMMFARRNTRP